MKIKTLIAKFKNLITGKPQFLIEPIAPIKEAFISGGITYYQFEDIFSLPCQRAFEAKTFYEELNSGISAEYLKQHIEAMDVLLNDNNGINITKIITLIARLKERQEFVIDADIVFKLASVVYFDKNESPYQYDMKYNHTKIKNWKENNEDIADFFLSTPIRNLIPFTNTSANDLRDYLKTVELLKKRQKNEVLSILSKKAVS